MKLSFKILMMAMLFATSHAFADPAFCELDKTFNKFKKCYATLNGCESSVRFSENSNACVMVNETSQTKNKTQRRKMLEYCVLNKNTNTLAECNEVADRCISKASNSNGQSICLLRQNS